MTTEAIKSTQVTNADASARVLNNPIFSRGDTYESVDVCAVANGVTTGSTYRFARVSSSAVVTDVQVMCDALTGGIAYNIGVLETAANGGGNAGGVANSNLIFGTSVDLHLALAIWTSKLFPSTAAGSGAVANVNKRVWELLGLTVDPFKDYDVVVSSTNTTSAGGNLALKVVMKV